MMILFVIALALLVYYLMSLALVMVLGLFGIKVSVWVAFVIIVLLKFLFGGSKNK